MEKEETKKTKGVVGGKGERKGKEKREEKKEREKREQEETRDKTRIKNQPAYVSWGYRDHDRENL